MPTRPPPSPPSAPPPGAPAPRSVSASRSSAIETEAGRITGVTTDRELIACGGVVLATGVMGNALLEPLGLHLPMTPRAVTLLRTVPVAPVLAQVVGVADASCAGRQEVDGRFRFTGSGGPWLGGTDFPDAPVHDGRRPGPRLRPKVGDVARVAGLFGALVPAALDAPLDETWIGLIDSTPDALPVIERTGPDGLVLAMGFSGHGFCLGPVTGRICASLARGETPNLPIEPFRLARFGAAPASSEASALVAAEASALVAAEASALVAAEALTLHG